MNFYIEVESSLTEVHTFDSWDLTESQILCQGKVVGKVTDVITPVGQSHSQVRMSITDPEMIAKILDSGKPTPSMGARMIPDMFRGPCPYCNTQHTEICPRIKAIDYFQDGTIQRVEFKTAMDYPQPVVMDTTGFIK